MARTQGSHGDITAPKMRRAATRLFSQHGYAAVSMRQIAAEIGVQVGTLYNHTADKQTLLFDLMHDHMALLLDRIGTNSGLDPFAHLEEFVRFHIRFHVERPDAVFIAYMELRNLSPENFAVIEEMRRRYEDHLEGIIRAGKDQGVFAVGDTKIATLAVIAMLTGMTTWYRAGGRLSVDAIEAEYCALVKRSVSPDNSTG
ncbi:MAG: TetR/AcrR family transcriptional regulator [Roseobacter sp.]